MAIVRVESSNLMICTAHKGGQFPGTVVAQIAAVLAGASPVNAKMRYLSISLVQR